MTHNDIQIVIILLGILVVLAFIGIYLLLDTNVKILQIHKTILDINIYNLKKDFKKDNNTSAISHT